MALDPFNPVQDAARKQQAEGDAQIAVFGGGMTVHGLLHMEMIIDGGM